MIKNLVRKKLEEILSRRYHGFTYVLYYDFDKEIWAKDYAGVLYHDLAIYSSDLSYVLSIVAGKGLLEKGVNATSNRLYRVTHINSDILIIDIFINYIFRDSDLEELYNFLEIL